MSKIIEKMKSIKPHTYVSVIMIILVIVNYVLTLCGKPAIKFSEDNITYIVNTAISLVCIVYPAWKNNSVTDKAQIADDVLYALRDGKVTKDEIEMFIENNSKVE